MNKDEYGKKTVLIKGKFALLMEIDDVTDLKDVAIDGLLQNYFPMQFENIEIEIANENTTIADVRSVLKGNNDK